jgi:hypothetical protein
VPLVELRIGSGHWHLPDVDDPFHGCSGQQRGEYLEASIGMADGEEW